MKRRGGFTLVELLVVITIIGILVTILMPSLMQGRLLAERTSCMSNQKHLFSIVMMYMTQNNRYIPVHYGDNTNVKTWRVLLYEQDQESLKMLNCPSSEKNLATKQDVTNESQKNLGSFGIVGPQDPYGKVSGTNLNMVNNSADDPLAAGWRIEDGWNTPNSSIYIADAYLPNATVRYPSKEGANGTEWIMKPEDGDYQNKAAGTPRFADRHAGTNCLMLNGSVRSMPTETLDKMANPMAADNIWDVF